MNKSPGDYLTDDELDRMSSSSMYEERYVAASCPKLSRSLFVRLSMDENSLIKRNIAENQNCPIDLLEKLAFDDSLMVKNAVIFNSRVTVPILIGLTKDCDAKISSAAHMILRSRDVLNELLDE